MSRKTVNVKEYKARINTLLADKRPEYAEFRKGLAVALAEALHMTDNYNGFNYVEWMGGGYEQWKADGKPSDNRPYLGDMTRVFYF
jgi:hypothetical protein